MLIFNNKSIDDCNTVVLINLFVLFISRIGLFGREGASFEGISNF